MKRLLVLIMAITFLAGCATQPDPRIDQLEAKVKKLERQVIMGAATGAGANIYPVTGALTGGGTGALDKIGTTATKDAAIVMFSEEATWGNAFMPFALHAGNSGTEASPYLINSATATNDWELLDVYGKSLYGHIPYITTAVDCTIGTDCDGALVRIAWGGFIEVSVDGKIVTLPEIVAATPTAVQVVPGASLCVINKDANEHFHLNPHANDYITDETGTKQGTAGHDVSTTAAATSIGDYICVFANAADNWQIMGYRTSAIVKE